MYIGSKAAMPIVEKQVVSQQEAAKRDYEKTQKLIDQAFKQTKQFLEHCQMTPLNCWKYAKPTRM